MPASSLRSPFNLDPDLIPMAVTLPTQTIDLSCGPVAYRRGGSGSPLILIHGWRGTSNHWQETLSSLADLREVHALDLPGHGDTPPRQDPLTPEGLAALTLEYADRAGLDEFDLMGHSFGVVVAINLASGQPRRVRRLVLSSLGLVRNDLEHYALLHTHSAWNLALSWWRPWLMLTRPWAGMGWPWQDWLSANPMLSRAIAAPFLRQWPLDPGLVREGVRDFLTTDPLSALEIAVSANSARFKAAIDGVRAPVLLLSGDRDPIAPVSAVEALGQRLSDCRTVFLMDCGHLPMVEWPEVFHAQVRNFLEAEEAISVGVHPS